MNTLFKHSFSIMIFWFVSLAHAGATTEIAKKVEALNAQSVKTLGVSLNALHYLVSADGNSFLLLSNLESTGDIHFIRELEAKKYVKTEKSYGLPDGYDKKVLYLRLVPLRDGIELQRCLYAQSAVR